jgi:uncharacterized cupredoxin-like copper-binding protein
MQQMKLLALAGLFALGAAQAHEGAVHKGSAGPVVKEQKPWGIAGDRKDARRTIDIRMTDDMRFTPAVLQVREGETVRLRVRNGGKLLHELVIGTRQELDAHAELMRKHPNMEHDEPYMTHVKAGATGEIVWNFNRAGAFEYACLIPGHYQTGMVGRIQVIPKKEQTK